MERARLQIQLLGDARISGIRNGERRLERKTAALVAYLALEGSTVKSKLAGLLWSESREATARSNLRQLLRRMRNLLGEDCTEGSDPLQLLPGVVVDAVELEQICVRKEFSRKLVFAGRLLGGYELDDCPDLGDWLRTRRERLERLQHHALELEATRLEREGAVGAALELARSLVDLDPMSEEAHRRVMHLHFILGDRAAALGVFRSCEGLLRRELGVGPSAETRQLAQLIQQYPPAAKLPAGKKTRGPLNVARPPVLVGRSREWAEMEAAWAARKAMFVCGEPGVGKSRLITDFAASKGRWLYLEARPGDRGTPFSTHARSTRLMLALHPDRPLEPWIQREIGRLLPERRNGSPPLPSSSEEQALFFSAVAELYYSSCQDLDVVVFDDGHYIDPSSFDLALFVHTQRPATVSRPPVFINSFRPGELDPEREALIRELAHAGSVAWIDLKPLTPAEVHMMLVGMETAGLERVSAEMARYTGGNPLFIVETAKHLLESGSFDGTFPASMPPPGRVRSVIERRLGRLSPEALELARVIAVAQTDFNVELASDILDVSSARLVDPWKELELAHILKEEWFTHDLLGETVLETIPEALRAALARRIDERR